MKSAERVAGTIISNRIQFYSEVYSANKRFFDMIQNLFMSSKTTTITVDVMIKKVCTEHGICSAVIQNCNNLPITDFVYTMASFGYFVSHNSFVSLNKYYDPNFIVQDLQGEHLPAELMIDCVSLNNHPPGDEDNKHNRTESQIALDYLKNIT